MYIKFFKVPVIKLFWLYFSKTNCFINHGEYISKSDIIFYIFKKL